MRFRTYVPHDRRRRAAAEQARWLRYYRGTRPLSRCQDGSLLSASTRRLSVVAPAAQEAPPQECLPAPGKCGMRNGECGMTSESIDATSPPDASNPARGGPGK